MLNLLIACIGNNHSYCQAERKSRQERFASWVNGKLIMCKDSPSVTATGISITDSGTVDHISISGDKLKNIWNDIDGLLHIVFGDCDKAELNQTARKDWSELLFQYKHVMERYVVVSDEL